MKMIKLLGIGIIVFGIVYFLFPLGNIFLQQGYFKNSLVLFTTNLFYLFIFILCGLGILRYNNLFRLLWLVVSILFILRSIPTLIMLCRGFHVDLYTYNDFPLDFWFRNFMPLILYSYSVILLSIPRFKKYFKENKGNKRDVSN